MKHLTITVLLAFTAGCSTVGDYLVDLEAPEKAASVVDRYGTEVPKEQRASFREAINSRTESCDIEVNCVGD